jgi:hypothetical protein
MRRSIKQAWLTMLRDVRQKQCFERLIAPDPEGVDGFAHCALGLLAERGVTAGVLRRKGRRVPGFSDTVTRAVYSALFPQSCRLWAGLTIEEVIAVVRLNDKMKWTFPEIADYIEQHIPAEEDRQ